MFTRHNIFGHWRKDGEGGRERKKPTKKKKNKKQKNKKSNKERK